MEERYQEREEAQQLADMQELQSQLPDVELPEDAETEEPLFPDQQAMTNELPAQEDSEISEPIQVVNFHITDDALGRGTAKEKFRANIMAIQLLKKCESENRHATAEEQVRNENSNPASSAGQQAYTAQAQERLAKFYKKPEHTAGAVNNQIRNQRIVDDTADHKKER